jgi:hypothetical protein
MRYHNSPYNNTTEKMKKMNYTRPAVEITLVELEQGIAVGSAQMKPGDASTPDTPQVNEWQESGTFHNDFDI